MMVPVRLRLRARMPLWKDRWRTAGWSIRLHVRPWPEGLEGRALLSSITEYPIPLGNVVYNYGVNGQITPGPDGNVWFADWLNHTIDRVTPNGTITEFSTQFEGTDGGDFLWGITLGPNGTLAFSEPSVGEIATITTSGSVTSLTAVPGTSYDASPSPSCHDNRVGRIVMVDRSERQFDR